MHNQQLRRERRGMLIRNRNRLESRPFFVEPDWVLRGNALSKHLRLQDGYKKVGGADCAVCLRLR